MGEVRRRFWPWTPSEDSAREQCGFDVVESEPPRLKRPEEAMPPFAFSEDEARAPFGLPPRREPLGPSPMVPERPACGALDPSTGLRCRRGPGHRGVHKAKTSWWQHG